MTLQFKDHRGGTCFLDLPPEIRNIIYQLHVNSFQLVTNADWISGARGYVIHNDHILNRRNRKGVSGLPILNVHKTIASDILPIILSRVRLHAEVIDFDFDPLLNWIDSRTPEEIDVLASSHHGIKFLLNSHQTDFLITPSLLELLRRHDIDPRLKNLRMSFSSSNHYIQECDKHAARKQLRESEIEPDDKVRLQDFFKELRLYHARLDQKKQVRSVYPLLPTVRKGKSGC